MKIKLKGIKSQQNDEQVSDIVFMYNCIVMWSQPLRPNVDYHVPSNPSHVLFPQRPYKMDAIDGPKPSSVLFKTPPQKPPVANQNAGGDARIGQASANQINDVADRQTPSGDSPPNLSPAKNVYISQDTTTPNGILANSMPYPREV